MIDGSTVCTLSTGVPRKKEIINHFMYKNQKYVFFHGTIIPIIDIQSTCDRNE